MIDQSFHKSRILPHIFRTFSFSKLPFPCWFLYCCLQKVACSHKMDISYLYLVIFLPTFKQYSKLLKLNYFYLYLDTVLSLSLPSPYSYLIKNYINMTHEMTQKLATSLNHSNIFSYLPVTSFTAGKDYLKCFAPSLSHPCIPSPYYIYLPLSKNLLIGESEEILQRINDKALFLSFSLS